MNPNNAVVSTVSMEHFTYGLKELDRHKINWLSDGYGIYGFTLEGNTSGNYSGEDLIDFLFVVASYYDRIHDKKRMYIVNNYGNQKLMYLTTFLRDDYWYMLKDKFVVNFVELSYKLINSAVSKLDEVFVFSELVHIPTFGISALVDTILHVLYKKNAFPEILNLLQYSHSISKDGFLSELLKTGIQNLDEKEVEEYSGSLVDIPQEAIYFWDDKELIDKISVIRTIVKLRQ